MLVQQLLNITMDETQDRLVVPILDSAASLYSSYLPDELLLEILSYIPRDRANQSTIARFCAVSR
jgi:hypothetical protein